MRNSNTIEVLKTLYTTIFSQKFNEDGTELAVCDNFGQIGIFKLSDCLSADNVDKVKLPYLKFKVSNSSLYTLESINEFLICAPLNQIAGYKWKNFSKNKLSIKQAFKIELPLSNGLNTNIEINSLVCDLNNETKRLFSGCGNGEIYNFDLEYCKLINKYDAHKQCIYQILLKNNGNELVSASEDGQVKIWDLRSKTSTTSIKPFENQSCTRPNLGKHINCIAVDIDDNWLVCGGGPRLAMWHLRSLNPMVIEEFDDEMLNSEFVDELDKNKGFNHSSMFMPNVCRIYDNQIITGGNSNNTYIHTFDNKLKTMINSSSATKSIYDIVINQNKSSRLNKIMCVCGSSTKVDICSQFSYKAVSLDF